MKKFLFVFGFLLVGAMVMPTSGEAGRWVKVGKSIQEADGCVSQMYGCQSSFWSTACTPPSSKYERICPGGVGPL